MEDQNESLSLNKEEIKEAIKLLISAYKNGNKVLVCGNGGSASDSQHIVGELQKGFVSHRCLTNADKKLLEGLNVDPSLIDKLQYGLPTFSLTSEAALISAISNDIGGDYIFAQQVFASGMTDDVLIAISTSGNSKNVVLAAQVAKAKNMKVIGLIGKNKQSLLNKWCDIAINVPESSTWKIQELHIKAYHFICRKIEEAFFD